MLRHLDGDRSFSAVILDMDGLMLDTEIVDFRAWQRAAADFGWSISTEQYLQLLGRTHRDGWEILTGWWRERPATGGSLTAISDRAASYAGEEKIAVKDGLFDLLGWARREQVPVAVASSSTRGTVISRLRDTEVLECITAIAGGDEVANGKPAPDIFLLAASRLGCQPGDCVVIEDSDSGIGAASAAGMTPFLVPDSSIPRAVPAAIRARAYRVCASLTEVLAILSRAGLSSWVRAGQVVADELAGRARVSPLGAAGLRGRVTGS